MFQIEFDNQDTVVGIDLGTTNSLVAWMNLTKPEIIPGEDGGRIVPSIVSLRADGEVIVGNAARAELIDHPERSVYSVKRLMGRGIADVQEELKLFPFPIAEGSESVIRLSLGEKTLTPPEVSALILRQLKRNAETALGTPVTRAVITVPAYFNDAQRQATRDAGRIAGLEVLRLVNEPTAAALAYGLDKRKEGLIAVYDLGGGTFDISILRLHEGIFEVLATNGDTHLGGDDIDNLLLRIALEDIQSEWGAAISHNGSAVQTLRAAVIRAKEELSFAPAAKIEFAWQGKTYQREITRELFEGLIRDIVDRTLGPCRDCLRDANVQPEDIDEVVMVGGSTRIPLVRSAVEVLFRARPHTELNPDEVVALGAAVQAGILSGTVENQLLLDVTPLSLGIETYGGVVSKIIHRNSTIPASAGETFTTGVDGQTNVLIHVVQGERELAKDNRSLARFDLKGIAPMPAGMARIEVRFLIDANGILNVTARDARTGQEQSIDVKPSYGLTDEQVEAMIEASIDHAEADFEAAQMAGARVDADTILAAVAKARGSDAWAELGSGEKAAISSAIERVQAARDASDRQALQSAVEYLNEITRGLAEQMMNSAVSAALKGTKI
ncbi:MAG TPA: Fe-S protein assembly chaperone HscA [Bryobacteraceae bacterium]|nr:Fe-S protein assembly chaperone HscA [Bryobacteraceae bacterium]